MSGTFLLDHAGLELLIEGEPFPEEPVEGGMGQLHRATVGLLQTGRAFHDVEKPFRLSPQPFELPPLDSYQKPGGERKDRDDGEDGERLGARREHELPRSAWKGRGGLKNHHHGKIEAHPVKNSSPRTPIGAGERSWSYTQPQPSAAASTCLTRCQGLMSGERRWHLTVRSGRARG